MVSLRTPKGTVDLNPQQSLTLEEIVRKVKSIFESHNGVPINTPTFELREILMNKYGEDAKLIYNLEDQGGDICSLRYDLTVPFSRYLCMNRIQKIRRYQIANVFRRDNPSFKTGRLREFIQADFDICGSALPMVNDAEILRMIYDILIAFSLPYAFTIKINDKRILTGLLKVCKVPEDLQQTACSTIDKVGKLTTEEINNELITKGLSERSVSGINRLILNNENKTDLETILNLKEIIKTSKLADTMSSSLSLKNSSDESILDLTEFEKGVDDVEMLLKYLDIYKVKNIKLDLSLARGLDYYTGLIVEAVYEGVDVGSVVGGGRYDNLCASLSSNTLNVPCVGFSVGVMRIFALYPPITPEWDVFVGSGYGLNLEDRMDILNRIWALGLRAETFTSKRVNYMEQVEYAKKNNFSVGVFTGDNEISKGSV
ncbi:histidine-tRNA ligase [Vittaforma corneae ATCC 50505]|uniref:histidine--tRNA ligase n=1 Tax=Vittaforma corneae (strain ATCC 50505) TaxID=993615 RepID=L2GP93_VITCO|nr:histidine-tRNA ligase [Vittaforma corneae ATCC 50505]ELA42117.1 histidine-tRNA ligase [Vittaforma corneae ATCC 50505]